MSMLEDLLAQAGGNVDIGALASQFGVDPALAQSALGQLLPQLAEPGVNNAAAVAEVANQSGLDVGALAAMLPQLLGAVQGAGAGSSGVMGQLLAGLGSGDAAGGATMISQVASMLDRDGDGNPLDDIMAMLGKQ